MTTVGYGDLLIKYPSTRAFAVFFIYYCVGCYALALINLHEIYTTTLGASSPFGAGNSSSSTLSVEDAEANKFVLEQLLKRKVVNQTKDVDPLLEEFSSKRNNNSSFTSSPKKATDADILINNAI